MTHSSRKLRVYPEFTRLAFHVQPHADEILAWILLCTEAAREIFPNLDINNVEWLNDNNRDYRDFPECLHIGCGRDPRFDEHARNDGWHSACTLIASVLGLLHHPAWKKTIEDVRKEDLRARAKKGSIIWMIKSLYLYCGGNPEGDMSVIKWAEAAFCAEIDSCAAGFFSGNKPLTTKTALILLKKQGYEDVEKFKEMADEARQHEEQKREKAVVYLEKNHFSPDQKTHYFFQSENHGKLKLFVIESDNSEVGWACWNHFKGDIAVLRQKSGHTQIMTRHSLKMNLSGVQNTLIEIETVDGADWMIHGEDQTMVLNGSLKFKGVKPTGLSLDQIRGVIENVLCFKGATMSLAMSYSELEKALDEACCV